MKVSSESFAGFTPLDASFVFCPNSFLDLIIPTQKRGVVRLVGHILHQTLRWLNEEGHPNTQDVAVSYLSLSRHVGISRGAIRPTIEHAIGQCFLLCTQSPQASHEASAGTVGEYRLRWTENLSNSVNEFQGFYKGPGHRSPIPHEFFTHVLPNEPLTVIQVVACVLRHTVGYQTQFGRRQAHHLSFTAIQGWTGIRSRASLSQAIQTALSNGYISLVEKGEFSKTPRAAKYGVCWQPTANKKQNLSSSKNEPVQNVNPPQFRNRTESSSISRPANQFKNRTTKKESSTKELRKKQQTTVAADLKSELLAIGFDSGSADALLEQHDRGVVEQQIKWLPERAARNPIGLLRKAIAEDWDAPKRSEEQQIRERENRRRERLDWEKKQRERDLAAIDRRKQERRKRRERLEVEWGSLTPEKQRYFCQKAIQSQYTESMKDVLRKQAEQGRLHAEFLDALARELDLPEVQQRQIPIVPALARKMTTDGVTKHFK